MRVIRWSRVIAAIVGVSVLAATMAACLPDDEYERYQLLADTIQSRIVWIYERTHFDPKPTDIVIVGPSRTTTGISGPALESGLARRGIGETAVNFSLPENGRDLHWVILQQVLADKSPKMLVIGIVDNPSRSGHPAYKYIAPSADVIDPAFFPNRDYLPNLIYLPYRQILLFVARYFPKELGFRDRFETAYYRGSNFDSTLSYRSGTGKWVERERIVSATTLERSRKAYENWANEPAQGTYFPNVEFGNERTYVRRMSELAQARSIPIVFLFLPYYRGTSTIQERPFYEQYGPILDASFLAPHAEWFSDIAHLNHAGALILTDWLAKRLAVMVTEIERRKMSQRVEARLAVGGDPNGTLSAETVRPALRAEPAGHH